MPTWEPRVGETGDDQYDPGNVMASAACMNQIYAEIRSRYPGGRPELQDEYAGRRVSFEPVTIPGIVYDPPAPPKMCVWINYIRVLEGKSAYPWPSPWGVYPYSSRPPKFSREYILHLRKALST